MNYSDIVKALAAAGFCAMLGSMLAGTDEAPGKLKSSKDVSSRLIVVWGSIAAMKSGSSDRYFHMFC